MHSTMVYVIQVLKIPYLDALKRKLGRQQANFVMLEKAKPDTENTKGLGVKLAAI